MGLGGGNAGVNFVCEVVGLFRCELAGDLYGAAGDGFVYGWRGD